jgi:hypothetical protein
VNHESVYRARVNSLWRGVIAVTALTFAAGCSGDVAASGPVLISIQIDATEVSLPRTDLVTCHRENSGQFIMWWEATDVVVARRPLDFGYTSTLSINFTADPPVLHAFALTFATSTTNVDLRWLTTANNRAHAVTLDGSNGNYVLIGQLTASGSALQHDTRIRHHCPRD